MLKIMSDSKFFSVFLLGGIIFVITISFLFWGIAPPTDNVAGVIATVEDDRILVQEYYNKYDDEYRRLSEIYTTEEELAKLNIKENVLMSLIDRKVLLIAAENAGIDATDDELKQEIIAIPYFQRNGSFDPVLYERVLAQNRMTIQQFEAEFRNDVVITKMNSLVGETAELTPTEMQVLDAVKEGKEQLVQTFLSTKRDQAMRAYLESLKKGMDIVINRELL